MTCTIATSSGENTCFLVLRAIGTPPENGSSFKGQPLIGDKRTVIHVFVNINGDFPPQPLRMVVSPACPACVREWRCVPGARHVCPNRGVSPAVCANGGVSPACVWCVPGVGLCMWCVPGVGSVCGVSPVWDPRRGTPQVCGVSPAGVWCVPARRDVRRVCGVSPACMPAGVWCVPGVYVLSEGNQAALFINGNLEIDTRGNSPDVILLDTVNVEGREPRSAPVAGRTH